MYSLPFPFPPTPARPVDRSRLRLTPNSRSLLNSCETFYHTAAAAIAPAWLLLPTSRIPFFHNHHLGYTLQIEDGVDFFVDFLSFSPFARSYFLLLYATRRPGKKLISRFHCSSFKLPSLCGGFAESKRKSPGDSTASLCLVCCCNHDKQTIFRNQYLEVLAVPSSLNRILATYDGQLTNVNKNAYSTSSG